MFWAACCCPRRWPRAGYWLCLVGWSSNFSDGGAWRCRFVQLGGIDPLASLGVKRFFVPLPGAGGAGSMSLWCRLLIASAVSILVGVVRLSIGIRFIFLALAALSCWI